MDQPLIARAWHGRTAANKSDEYLKVLIGRAIPDYQAVSGNRGVTILCRMQDAEMHFLILTYWESRAAIEAFAGADIEQAKYYDEDRDFLLEFEPTVAHYEVCAAASTRPDKNAS